VEVIAMRRAGVIVALGALLGLFAGAVTASPAFAGRGPKWQFNAGQPFTLPADFCGFQIGVSFPVDKEYFKVLKAADGSMTFLITGALRVTNTNLSTGKSITSNISGPGKITFFPDGSVTTEETGRAIYALEPADAQRFGVPPIGLTAGPLTTSVDANGNLTSFSLQGHVLVDVCAALS
jgi:streptogramin lyase